MERGGANIDKQTNISYCQTPLQLADLTELQLNSVGVDFIYIGFYCVFNYSDTSKLIDYNSP